MLAHMLSHPFMLRALGAGGAVALVCGFVGYFLVLRAQVFTADALSHVAFTGAVAALAAGIDLRIGLFGACIAFGLAMAALGRRGRPDDVVIGNTFAWILGLGVLFLTVYSRSQNAGAAGVSVLFGSVFGITAGQAWTAAVVAGGLIVIILLVARPLMFASLDEAVAGARGVPVRALGMLFLAVVGGTAGEATQVVGALLVLGLLSAPAAAAHRTTANPWTAFALSGALSLGATWGGLILSYMVPSWPPSFSIVAVAVLIYAAAAVTGRFRGKRRRAALVVPASGTLG